MACRDVFPACPAEMLPTLRRVEDYETLHLDGKCPSQVGNVYNRPVSFQVRSACMYILSGGGVLVLSHDRPGTSFRQDGNHKGQDGKCDVEP